MDHLKNFRNVDDFMGQFDAEAIKDPQRLNNRVRTNVKYYYVNYIVMTIFCVVLNTLFGANPIISFCFALFLCILHACMRPQTVASAGSVKVQDAKNKAKSMVDAAKAKAKSTKVN